MEVISNKEELQLELQYLLDLFNPSEDFVVTHEEIENRKKIINKFTLSSPMLDLTKSFIFENDFDFTLSNMQQKSFRKKIAKVNLYDAMHSATGQTLPYGSLTGVRPTKFARDLVESGQVKEYLLAETLEKDYRVSKDKAKLIVQVIKNQRGIIRNDGVVDLYINIPICPSRCLYCSFISHEIGQVKDMVDSYLDCVIKELQAIKEIVVKKPYVVRNIYVGGGTPSVLSAAQIDKLLSEINFQFNEFTFECGRPETITAEKLDVLKKHGVQRICINPQTFSDKTLKKIGRKHSVTDVLQAYSLALEKDFVVNMDFIAGLPGEKLATFKKTINSALELFPDNITIHTLSIKRGGLLKFDLESVSDKEVTKMVDFAYDALTEKGYKPYYMYRQKRQLKGLENLGYARDNKICLFNIDSMEDFSTVIAVGAGAMSKRVFNVENRIERQPNPKFLNDYISRIDGIIQEKHEFFK